MWKNKVESHSASVRAGNGFPEAVVADLGLNRLAKFVCTLKRGDISDREERHKCMNVMRPGGFPCKKN